jgi:hypothetical protein
VSQHTGLLWALETIAWDKNYFDRTVMVLARLAALDPGGKLINRPINSLGEIFLPWHPSTKASVNQRLAALDRICDILPEIGWELLVKLLPTMHGMSSGTARPKLREAGRVEAAVTYAEYWEVQAAVVQRAIARVGHDPRRWQVLIAGLSNFTPAGRAAALLALDQTLRHLQGDDRKTLLEHLRREVEKHERFPDAKWVLPPDQLGPMRRMVANTRPTIRLRKRGSSSTAGRSTGKATATTSKKIVGLRWQRSWTVSDRELRSGARSRTATV